MEREVDWEIVKNFGLNIPTFDLVIIGWVETMKAWLDEVDELDEEEDKEEITIRSKIREDWDW